MRRAAGFWASACGVVAIALGAVGAISISYTTQRLLGGVLLVIAAVLATAALVGHLVSGRETAPRRRSQVNYQVRASIEPSWSSRLDGEVGDLPTVPFPPRGAKAPGAAITGRAPAQGGRSSTQGGRSSQGGWGSLGGRAAGGGRAGEQPGRSATAGGAPTQAASGQATGEPAPAGGDPSASRR